ncbi:hypothetical protein SDRG_11942 [Saprolegnia diclina VS20]|uniref:Importin N-terminal domain-containing protein n=1 Tax=Saprolegnia diclina (strain VS20) TaxID=1156394 RepID=T0QA38_SAPDV|nr:hypothetical protein SDRG_11942 [Saprolegnia diclina VS20]EQC30365.1 hypothetical protein SDRG_11942 [Saprolegnia diclina VS20]|eukprot:XP_008616218.1 hypothetical protein SDRG_11942 [Saprolegnia diclina VS20]
MDEHVYEQLLRAVDVCHATGSLKAERDAAYAYCEQFQQTPNCVSYAFYLLQQRGHASHHRHFALHVVENYIRVHWKNCSADETVQYRSTLLNIVASHVAADEPSFIKEKLVKVLADIAKRQFPQRWPDLLEQLLSLWSMGPIQAEIVMLLFRSIAEDCVSSSFNSTIPPIRRKDILQGLNACFPTLFPLVYQQLEMQYAQLQSPSADHKTANAVILAALQMMKEFLDWMPVNTPASPDTNFIAVASLLLQSPALQHSIRIAAAECLEVYFSRTFGKDHLALVVATTQTCWSALAQISVADVNDSDDLNLHLHVNRVLVSWGTHQLELLVAELPASHDVLLPFVELLLRFFQHPSLTVTEAQVIVWLNLLKQKKVVSSLLVPHNVLPALWRTSMDKYFKLHSPDRDDAHPVSALEFDDNDAYVAFYSNFRGRLYGILRLLLQLQPGVGLQLLYERLQYVLSAHARGTDALDEHGHCTDSSTAHLYHEGLVALIDCIMKSLPESALNEASHLATLSATVEALLAYETPDPWLLFRHCLALSLFAKYYMRAPGLYPRVFERLFGLIVFAQPGETILTTMDPTTMNVRRRALASLISICHASPSHVLPFLPILCNQVIGLFPVVLDSESVLLYEMLVLVSNSLPTADERTLFIGQITAEPLASWTSPAMTALVASPSSLVAAMTAKDDALVFGLVKVLTTLYGIARRIVHGESVHPFASVWPVLLPNLLSLLRTLQTLPVEQHTLFAASDNSDVRGVLCMSQEEVVQALVGKEQVPALQPDLLKYARWAKNVRDIGYHLVGCALSLPSFYALVDIPSLASMLDQAVLVHMETMEHRHWKSFLASVWLPFVKGCPETHLAPLLEPRLQRVLLHLSSRLAPVWAGSPSPTAHLPMLIGLDMQATTIDTVQNAVVLEVVRHTVDLIEALVDAKTVVDVDSDHPKHIMMEKDRVRRDFVLASPALTHALTSLLLGVLMWRDTLSARRSAILLDRLVSLLFGRLDLGGLLGKDVFTAALTALLAHFYDVDDGLKWELVNLLRNIYCRLTLGLLPVDECKGIDPVNQPRKRDEDINPWPRQLLLGLATVETGHVVELEAALRQQPSLKAQKNLMKEFLETPFLAYRDAPHTFKAIDDLPEALVLPTKAKEAHDQHDDGVGLLFQR